MTSENQTQKPAGRPPEYGEGHKFRLRDGKPHHVKDRCPVCKGAAQ